MGCPAVLLFPVRGKLQSLQTSVLIGPYSVSWKPSRCRLIGLSFHCEDFAANWCLPGWVPLPLPTSCCSQSAYSAARVCVRVFVRVCVCGHPFLPLPSFSSTKQPAHPPFHSHPPFPHLLIRCVFLSHTHTLLNKHSHTPATWGPAAAWCVWVTGESYIGACMCVCVFNAAASLQQISASLGTEHNRTRREGRSRFTAAESGILHKVMIAWSHVKMLFNDTLLL